MRRCAWRPPVALEVPSQARIPWPRRQPAARTGRPLRALRSPGYHAKQIQAHRPFSMCPVIRLWWNLARTIFKHIAEGLGGLLIGAPRSCPGQGGSRKGPQGRKEGKKLCSAANGRACSQGARVLADELPREAFGVRGACSRFRTTPALRQRQQAGRTPNASRSSVAALPRCVLGLCVRPSDKSGPHSLDHETQKLS